MHKEVDVVKSVSQSTYFIYLGYKKLGLILLGRPNGCSKPLC